MPEPAADALKHCFPPVADDRTRLLLLGSLPGEESLARGQYYANPRNQFWRLIGAVIERDLVPLAYEERLQVLLGAGVGLWDTVAEATRAGSLDTAIRDHRANDLSAFVDRLPALRAIGFNGGKAAAIGGKLLVGDRRHALIALPSSSPAFTRSFDEKLAEWMTLRPYLSAG